MTLWALISSTALDYQITKALSGFQPVRTFLISASGLVLVEFGIWCFPDLAR